MCAGNQQTAPSPLISRCLGCRNAPFEPQSLISCALPGTKLGAPCSHSAGAAADTQAAMGPEEGTATTSAVAVRPRPPTRPRAQRPAAAAPKAMTAGGAHDNLRPALRAVAPPGDRRPPLRPGVQQLPPFPARLREPDAEPGVPPLPPADGGDMDTGQARGHAQDETAAQPGQQVLDYPRLIHRSNSLAPATSISHPKDFHTPTRAEGGSCGGR
jgi:hypothetical protein